MSDVSQGPGWWEASDGKWYPPAPTQNEPSAAGPSPIAVPPEPGGVARGAIHSPAPPHSAQQPGYPSQYARQPAQPFAGGGGPVQPKRRPNPAAVFASIGGVLIVILLGVIGYLLTRETDTQASEQTTVPTVPATDPPATEPPATEPPVTEPAPTEPPTTQPPTTPSELTPTQQAAADEAARLLEDPPYSRSTLIDRLADEFTREDAAIGIDSLNVDWNEQALIAGQNYVDLLPFSYDLLVRQLRSRYGSGFTNSEAMYAADNVTVDWNAEAAEAAEEAMKVLDKPTCTDVLENLTQVQLFTPEQAQSGAEQAGIC